MIKPEFENTIRFAGRIVAPPDYRQYFPTKRSRSQSSAEWVRNWEITGLYLGTDKTLEEIGTNLHLTGERVRQIIQKNLKLLYYSSDERIKAEFPWESLETRKPLSIEYRQNLTKLLTGTLPYDEAQKIIDQVTRGTLQRSSSGGKRDFLSVAKLAQQSGLFDSHRKASIFADELKANQIPVGLVERRLVEKPNRESHILRYYFIPFCYEERTKEILHGLSATF